MTASTVSTRPTLLLCARDPNAAQQIAAIARRAFELGWFTPVLVAAAPGYGMLEAEGLPVREVNAPTASTAEERAAAVLVARARALLAEIGPDAVLVGLSGPEAGIDEGLLAAAGDIPTYAIQDFWGDVNRVLGFSAGCYFVTDQEAAEMTHRLHGAMAVVTGQPKYEDYRDIDATAFARGRRQAMGVPDDTALIGFFGQPLSHLRGYREMVAALVGAVNALGRPARFFYRAHPKDTAVMRQTVVRIMGEARIEPAMLPQDGRVNALLAACDVVATAFSSCGYDAIMLERMAETPTGAVLYTIPADVAAAYRERTGVSELPPVRDGLALMVKRTTDVPDRLRHALDPNVRRGLWSRIRERVPEPTYAAERILDRVRADLALKHGKPLAQR